MSKVCPEYSPTWGGSEPTFQSLAICSIGPFPRAMGNQRWLLVRTDYFTKWVKVESLSSIKDVDAKRFIWRNIITRFGVPHTLILYNGLQFDSKAFQRYCGELGIKNRYYTPTYPQGMVRPRLQIRP